VTDALLAALTWEPQIKGALYVLLAVLILVGSCYMLLATNTGARLGLLLATAGLFGWLTTMGIIWWVYGRGPVGPSPAWERVTVVSGNLRTATQDVVEDFPSGWTRLQPSDPSVADAAPIADGALAPEGGRGAFREPSDYVMVAAYEKGGEAKGPLGIGAPRPLNLFHTPHYLIIEVQRAQPAAEGQTGPRQPDPSAQPVSVVLIRNLGALRLHPAVFTIASGIIFGLACYQLHVRDKEAAARREAEGAEGGGRGLEPVRS
jgi:hypothetical protein